eukprot:m.31291 g.31291  ORF g.31291 m.31291 type:complete len:819 (+) comp13962_c0_seq3:199-2655(+)
MPISQMHQTMKRWTSLISRIVRVGARGAAIGSEPVPPIGLNVAKTAHGCRWKDAYGRMQISCTDLLTPTNVAAEKVAKFLDDENNYTNSCYGNSSAFGAFRDSQMQAIDNLSETAAIQSEPQPDCFQGYIYFSRVDENTGLTMHYRKEQNQTTAAGAASNEITEEILFDPAAFGAQIGIDRHSPDLQHVHLRVSPGNNRFLVSIYHATRNCTAIYALEQTPTASGKQMRVIDHVVNTGSAEWVTNDTFLYTTVDAMLRPHTVWLKNLSRNQNNAQVIDTGTRGSDRMIHHEADERFFVHVSASKDGDLISINSNSKKESKIWVLPGTEAQTQIFNLCPIPVWHEPNKLCFVEHHAGYVYAMVNSGATDGLFKLVRLKQRLTELARQHNDGASLDWVEVATAPPNHTLHDVDFFTSGIVMHCRDLRGLPVYNVIPYPATTHTDASTPTAGLLRLPNPAAVASVVPRANADPASTRMYFRTASPLVPCTDWVFPLKGAENAPGAAARLVTPLTLPQEETLRTDGYHGANTDEDVEGVTSSPALALERLASSYRCERLSVQHDDVTVPVTVTFPREGAVSSAASVRPLLVRVYGAYGESLELDFNAGDAALLLRGWSIAHCHVRGGGELGTLWHQQGREKLKQNSIHDLLACLDALVDRGYATSHAAVCVEGISAGGFVAAAACNIAPASMGALVLKVPFVDVLSSMLDPTLPLTQHESDEWGDVIGSADAFHAVRAVCPYTNLRTQTYPPVFAIGATDDDRVQFWHAAKYIARLREVDTSSNKKHLYTLRGGHFAHDSTRTTSLVHAFLYEAVYGSPPER